MNKIITLGIAAIGVSALSACTLPMSQSDVPTPVVTVTPTPTPTPASDADVALATMMYNWNKMSATDQDGLCQYWRNYPNRAWEVFSTSDNASNDVSKNQFTEFFTRQCT